MFHALSGICLLLITQKDLLFNFLSMGVIPMTFITFYFELFKEFYISSYNTWDSEGPNM